MVTILQICGAPGPLSGFGKRALCVKMAPMDAKDALGFFGTLAATVAYGGLHSLLASRRVKRAVESALGPAVERWYPVTFNAIGMVTLIPVLAVPYLLSGRLLYVVRPPWLWITLGGQALAALAVLYGLLQTGLGRFLGFSQLLGGAEQQGELVAEGLYRWVRHPLYTAGIVFIWLVPLMTTSILALNIGFTAYLYIGSLFEERKLLAQHGEAYEEYREQVPRLIPRPWRRYSSDI